MLIFSSFIDLWRVNTNYYKIIIQKYFNGFILTAVNGKVDTGKNISAHWFCFGPNFKY